MAKFWLRNISSFDPTVEDIEGALDRIAKSVNRNFKTLNYLMTERLDAWNVLELPALKITGTLQAGQIVVGAESSFEEGYDPSTKLEAEDLEDLGDLAFEDVVEIAKLGTSIVDGGYLQTILIDADYIQAGIITGITIRTADTPNRLEMSGGSFKAYKDNVLRVALQYDEMEFYDSDGNIQGAIYAVKADQYNPTSVQFHAPNRLHLSATKNLQSVDPVRGGYINIVDDTSIGGYVSIVGYNASLSYGLFEVRGNKAILDGVDFEIWNRVGIKRVPTYDLDVAGASRIDDRLSINTTPDASNRLRVNGYIRALRIGTGKNPVYDLDIGADARIDNRLSIATTIDSSNRLRVNGYVRATRLGAGRTPSYGVDVGRDADGSTNHIRCRRIGVNRDPHGTFSIDSGWINTSRYYCDGFAGSDQMYVRFKEEFGGYWRIILRGGIITDLTRFH